MKKLILFGIAIICLFSCKKQRFGDCENYDKLVGEWKCIDNPLGDYVLVKESGIVIFFFTNERKQKYNLTDCEYYQGTEDIPKSFKLRQKELFTWILVNETFDTIAVSGGAYNDNFILDQFSSYRRYIKVD